MFLVDMFLIKKKRVDLREIPGLKSKLSFKVVQLREPKSSQNLVILHQFLLILSTFSVITGYQYRDLDHYVEEAFSIQQMVNYF